MSPLWWFSAASAWVFTLPPAVWVICWVLPLEKRSHVKFLLLQLYMMTFQGDLLIFMMIWCQHLWLIRLNRKFCSKYCVMYMCREDIFHHPSKALNQKLACKCPFFPYYVALWLIYNSSVWCKALLTMMEGVYLYIYSSHSHLTAWKQSPGYVMCTHMLHVVQEVSDEDQTKAVPLKKHANTMSIERGEDAHI